MWEGKSTGCEATAICSELDPIRGISPDPGKNRQEHDEPRLKPPLVKLQENKDNSRKVPENMLIYIFYTFFRITDEMLFEEHQYH
jgi:hypothetical protein